MATNDNTYDTAISPTLSYPSIARSVFLPDERNYKYTTGDDKRLIYINKYTEYIHRYYRLKYRYIDRVKKKGRATTRLMR